MSAPHPFGRDDPDSYAAAVEAAGVTELEDDHTLELPNASEREALYQELFGALYDPARMNQPDQIRTGQPEPDLPGGP